MLFYYYHYHHRYHYPYHHFITNILCYAPSVITCIIGGAIQMSVYITFTFTHQASRRAPPIRLYAAKVQYNTIQYNIKLITRHMNLFGIGKVFRIGTVRYITRPCLRMRHRPSA